MVYALSKFRDNSRKESENIFLKGEHWSRKCTDSWKAKALSVLKNAYYYGYDLKKVKVEVSTP